MQNDNKATGNEPEENLKDVAVLNDEGLTFGLPHQFFWGGVMGVIAFAVVLRDVWYLSVVFGFVYFVAVYAMHENNPKAARSWLRALSRPVSWQAARHKRRNVISIK